MVRMSFTDAWHAVPAESREAARDALLALSNHLYEVDEKWSQLGPEARMIWLDAQMPIATPAVIHRVIARVSSVVGFLDNWTQVVGTDQNDAEYDFIHATSTLGEAALRALHAIVDQVRARTLA